MNDDLISRRRAIELILNGKIGGDSSLVECVEECNSMLDWAADEIKAMPSTPRWIPVTERLPEDEQEVLVTRHFLSDNQLKKNAITESFYVEVASRTDDEWTSYSDEYKIKRHLHKVVAWMPLPTPWKGEDDDRKA